VVHRDVSPGNLFLTVDGSIKVLDFGIAKASWGESRTHAGTMLGKCDYVSPEQAQGGEVDRRSDLFALGTVLHQLLTGRRLFRRGNEHKSLRAVVRDPVPSAASCRPGVPASLDAVLLAALRRDRAQRFPTAATMRQAIELAMAGHGGVASRRELATR